MAAELEPVLRRIADALERLAPAPAPAPGDAPAWQWTAAGPAPVTRVDWVAPEQMVGVDDVLAAVDANTRRFVTGRPANDVLLWGDRGTGKSSIVKAMLTRHHAAGLRLVSLPLHDFGAIARIGDWVEKRPERYVLFLDDLSFSAEDAVFRALKSILEGGVAARPANLLVYATSNRRHLLPEYLRENEPAAQGGEIHPREAVQDKIALADRFGLRIGLYAPDQETYLETVDRYLDFYGLPGDRDELHRDALRFALQAGQRSGRTAHQFVRSLPLAG
jgi:predicted AAA+ superfamily ATPase